MSLHFILGFLAGILSAGIAIFAIAMLVIAIGDD